MRLLPKSARGRLAITYALTVMLLIVGYSASLYYLYRRDVLIEYNKKLRSDFETIEMMIEQNHAQGLPEKEIANLNSSNLSSANWLTEVWSIDGKRLFSSGDQEAFPLGQLSPECLRPDSNAQ